ncbi:MAG: PLP-dependent aminotransferase family protein [bacterium]|nr:PLP-dependent aminotransferase family protein [bacterium]
MDIQLDRTSRIPIYLQILNRFREMIISGAMPEGALLPPERQLAQELGLNRSTVLSAYRELKKEGLVEARVGRGTTVLPLPSQERSDTENATLSWRHIFRTDTARSQSPLLRDLLALSERKDVIPMSLGLPAPELLPVDLFQQIQTDLARELGPTLLQHSPTEGVTELRETLCDLAAERGISCDPTETLILSGSQQGLDLASRVFIEPGDTVIVEEPTFFAALQTFNAHQARLIGVPCDQDGMRTDLLAEILERRHPKFIYTLPTFQNPSGSVMSLTRRKELLQLAYRYQVPIIEDDPYCDLRYEGDSVPSLKSLDQRGLVLYLSTMSKVLFPGLRVGWLLAPREVIRRFTLVKQSMDLHCNTPGQWVINTMLRDGHYQTHLNKVRRAYACRRDIMADALRKDAPSGFEWTKPKGGFYFWCRLPDEVERSQLLAESAAAGVSFLPGWPCFVDDPGCTYLRLNFSFAGKRAVETGVARLLEALHHSCRKQSISAREAGGTPPIV